MATTFVNKNQDVPELQLLLNFESLSVTCRKPLAVNPSESGRTAEPKIPRCATSRSKINKEPERINKETSRQITAISAMNYEKKAREEMQSTRKQSRAD